jgi:hypothetical protein
VVEESGVKVVFRALRRSGHYAVTNGMPKQLKLWRVLLGSSFLLNVAR